MARNDLGPTHRQVPGNGPVIRADGYHIAAYSDCQGRLKIGLGRPAGDRPKAIFEDRAYLQ